MGIPTLFALCAMGAVIVTTLVLKPHTEACSFGLSYIIAAITSLCWEIIAIPDVTVMSPLPSRPRHDDITPDGVTTLRCYDMIIYFDSVGTFPAVVVTISLLKIHVFGQFKR